MSSLTRLGRVSYVNVNPIYMGLTAVGAPYAPNPGVPTELNALLAADRLDCAPSSSIELAAHPGRYLVAPDVCVASDGAVGSALLLSRVPVAELDGRSIAITTHTATTMALLQVLCRDHWGIAPSFERRDPERAFDDSVEACLLIGDPALRAAVAPGAPHVYDLGAEWTQLTGLPMVFAMWLVRREWAEAQPEAAAELNLWLGRALEWWEGGAGLESVVRASAEQVGLPQATLEHYFSLQRYRFTSERRRGLEEFLRRAAAAGLVPPGVAVETSEVTAGVKA